MKYLSEHPLCHHSGAQGFYLDRFLRAPAHNTALAQWRKIRKTFPFVLPTQGIYWVVENIRQSLAVFMQFSNLYLWLLFGGEYIRALAMWWMVPGRHFCEARDLIRQFEAGALDEVPFRFNRVTEIVKNCLGIQISSSVSHSCYCCRIMTLYLTCLKHTVRCLPWKIPLVYILVVDSEIFK